IKNPKIRYLILTCYGNTGGVLDYVQGEKLCNGREFAEKRAKYWQGLMVNGYRAVVAEVRW
ncbi:MAG: hypothetical protein KGL35_04585, partial [Bradyrhizobium sp.]|nr:hypothetical protein [Bradyrhizobium sp.]